MSDKAAPLYDQSTNTSIQVKYVDMGDGSYARQLIDVGDTTGKSTNTVNLFDQSANTTVPQKFFIMDDSQARLVVRS